MHTHITVESSMLDLTTVCYWNGVASVPDRRSLHNVIQQSYSFTRSHASEKEQERGESEREQEACSKTRDQSRGYGYGGDSTGGEFRKREHSLHDCSTAGIESVFHLNKKLTDARCLKHRLYTTDDFYSGF